MEALEIFEEIHERIKNGKTEFLSNDVKIHTINNGLGLFGVIHPSAISFEVLSVLNSANPSMFEENPVTAHYITSQCVSVSNIGEHSLYYVEVD